jgi:hypothetical protein
MPVLRRLGFLGLVLIPMAVLAWQTSWHWSGDLGGNTVVVLEGIAHLIEAAALLYGVAFCVAAVRYVHIARQPGPVLEDEPRAALGKRRAAILYLCCGDLEPAAVESLSRLEYDGSILHLLHDDSTDPEEQREVDRVVDELEKKLGVRWRVLRRPAKGGGKSAVTNYVSEQTSGEHDFFLLADNDSFSHDPKLLLKAASLLDDDEVAVVQFRCVNEHRPDEGGFIRLLGGAVDMFDAFMTGLYRGLWQPFVGHNAVLRTRDLLEAGGFTPGVFADDIDLTVRMNRNGKQVVYRRDLEMGEYHPPNYRSFCERSRKWSTGCAQVLRMHGLRVLFDSRLSIAHKAGFFLFSGFYLTQAAIVIYVLITFLLLPIISGDSWQVTGWALAVGTFLPVAIFFPVVAYLRTEGRHLPFWQTLGVCAATYGSTDWWTLNGLARGLRNGNATWLPTNRIGNSSKHVADWAHFTCGLTALAIPWVFQPQLLLFPITWLFAAKLIFVPVVAACYREDTSTSQPIRSALHTPAGAMSVLVFAFMIVSFSLLCAASAFGADKDINSAPDVRVEKSRLLINGNAPVLKGISYSPWRPGTGPQDRSGYPGEAELREDLDLIRHTGANTILAYDPTDELVDLAHEYGLFLIHTFHIEWPRLPQGELAMVSQEITARVSALKGKPAIIAWMVGNEVKEEVIDEMGPAAVGDALGDLRKAVRKVDPGRPVCHGTLALHRTLGLDDQMDIVTYNIYPFYPTEVAINGYERFIRDEILPLANGRPVVVTEFGVNSLEASEERQAEVLKQCWDGLRAVGCQGGMVFSFADEWWKNYENPIREPNWWRRAHAPDDHLRHDRDPEEYYGIVRSDRKPKPAYEMVRAMFAGSEITFTPIANPELERARLMSRLLWLAGGVGVFSLAATAVLLYLRSAPAGPNAKNQVKEEAA